MNRKELRKKRVAIKRAQAPILRANRVAAMLQNTRVSIGSLWDGTHHIVVDTENGDDETASYDKGVFKTMAAAIAAIDKSAPASVSAPANAHVLIHSRTGNVVAGTQSLESARFALSFQNAIAKTKAENGIE